MSKLATFDLDMIDADKLPCGECKACCTVLAVAEYDKPNFTPCKHECDSGCSIYAERPTSCRVWSCAWKSGRLGDERRRPDKLGVIFDHRPTGVWVWEVWEGAAQNPQVKYLIEKQTKGIVPVLILNPEYEDAMNWHKRLYPWEHEWAQQEVDEALERFNANQT